MSTLATLRQITHALRGWPTPLRPGDQQQRDHVPQDGSTDDEAAAASATIQARQLRRLRAPLVAPAGILSEA